MTDITETLRNRANFFENPDYANNSFPGSLITPLALELRQAADEIDRQNAEIQQLRAELAERNGQEPVAWRHDNPARVDVIADEVKRLLNGASASSGHLHRTLDKTAHYTIPLYRHPPSPRPAVPEGDNHKLDTDEQVFFYEQEFYVLSNFSAFTLTWKGLRFDTSEAAYHWEKFPMAHEIRDSIRTAASAHDAFQIAAENKDHRRKDWDDVKVDVMKDILRAKAHQHEYVRRKLRETGHRELIEDSWRDSVWGWGPDRNGQNLLGKLWMEVREEMLTAAPTPPADASGDGREAWRPMTELQKPAGGQWDGVTYVAAITEYGNILLATDMGAWNMYQHPDPEEPPLIGWYPLPRGRWWRRKSAAQAEKGRDGDAY